MAVINSSRFTFAENINDILMHFYEVNVIPAMKAAIDEVGREAAKKLKAESPRGTGKKSGTYAKGWAYKSEVGKINAGGVVYGRNGTYQLAHLLEYGHAKRNGGRSKSIVHIKPVEEWAIEEVQERFIQKMGGFS